MARRTTPGRKGERGKVNRESGQIAQFRFLAQSLRSTCPGPGGRPGSCRGSSGEPRYERRNAGAAEYGPRNRPEARAGRSHHLPWLGRYSAHRRNCHSSNPLPTQTRCRAYHIDRSCSAGSVPPQRYAYRHHQNRPYFNLNNPCCCPHDWHADTVVIHCCRNGTSYCSLHEMRTPTPPHSVSGYCHRSCCSTSQ